MNTYAIFNVQHGWKYFVTSNGTENVKLSNPNVLLFNENDAVKYIKSQTGYMFHVWGIVNKTTGVQKIIQKPI